MRTEVSCCHLLMLGSLLLSGAQASPKERLKVKYKIKKSNNNGEHLEKQKVRVSESSILLSCSHLI